jgi:hypothetical protein
MGHEFRGGLFSQRDRASKRAAKVDVRREPSAVSVVIASSLAGMPFTRTLTLSDADPFLHLEVTGLASRRFTVTCRFELSDGPTSLDMDTVGGQIERPHERTHQPTFWPVPSMVTLAGPHRALHVGFEAPTAVSFTPERALDWIVARNASKERAFRFLPVLAHPIGGTSDEPQTHRAAIFATPGRAVSREQREMLELAWLPPELRAMKRVARLLVRLDDPSVSMTATKRADRGPGIIVRLASTRRASRTVRLWLTSRRIHAASSCDAREEDQAPLAVEEGCALVPLSSRLTSVRLVHGEIEPASAARPEPSTTRE